MTRQDHLNCCVCLSIYLSMYLSIHPSVYPSEWSIFPSYLSIYIKQFVHRNYIYICLYVYVCLHICIYGRGKGYSTTKTHGSYVPVLQLETNLTASCKVFRILMLLYHILFLIYHMTCTIYYIPYKDPYVSVVFWAPHEVLFASAKAGRPTWTARGLRYAAKQLGVACSASILFCKAATCLASCAPFRAASVRGSRPPCLQRPREG